MADEPSGESDRRTQSKRTMPRTPDLGAEKWGVVRKGSPFALDDFSSGAPANTTKP